MKFLLGSEKGGHRGGGAIGTNERNPDGRDGRAMRTCGPRCSVRRRGR